MKRFVQNPLCLSNLISAILLFFTSDAYCDDKASSQTVAPRSSVQSVTSGRFRQQVRTNYGVAEGLPEGAIHSLAFDQKLYAATEKGIAAFLNGRWQLQQATQTPVTQVIAAEGKVWYAQDKQVFLCQDAGQTKLVASVPANSTLTSLIVSQGSLYLGNTSGLYVADAATLVPVREVNQLLQDKADVRQLATYGNEIVVAAQGGLVSYNTTSKQATILTPRQQKTGWALEDVRGVSFDSAGNLWFAAHQGVGQRSKDGWKLFTGHDGLPYDDFTCVATGIASDVWFGTRLGAIRYTGSHWEYRQGKRWLADDVVNSIIVTPTGDAWFATATGATCIESRPTTLREKSAFFNAEIDRYHRRTPFGYVDSIRLEKAGDKSNGIQYDSDNDGLWTSMYGAAQCYEYAVTRSPESKKRADDAFRAIAFLSEVTRGGKNCPPEGFPARSILPTSGRDPNLRDSPEKDEQHRQNDPLWKVITPRWPVSADQQWYWKTDTSSDELDGHYYFYGLYYDLVADTDERKRDVRAVVERVSNHLIEHDYQLIDHDGKPTRWGRFSPTVLNGDVLSDCRGLNSVSVLSYLIVAEHVTGDKKYREKADDLLYKHHYFTNVINPKHQNGPGAGNQSDDEMAFMCYYNLFNYETDPKLRRQYMRSLARYFAQEEYEACPLFNFIFAAFYEPVRHHWKSVPTHLIEDSLETLERYPLDRIHWGYKNSHRLDIVGLGRHIPVAEGRGHLRNGKVIPIDERFVNHWNVDPWRLDSNAAGYELADGTSFLLPFWLGVYHGFIKETDLPTK